VDWGEWHIAGVALQTSAMGRLSIQRRNALAHNPPKITVSATAQAKAIVTQ
jgi:hypothetical protein